MAGTTTNSILTEDGFLRSAFVRLGFQETEWAEWKGPDMHTCKGILSTAVHTLNKVRHLAVRCFPGRGGRDGSGEPSSISWFKNHTCETGARWEILLVDSAEATVHYQVMSPGHFEVISLINVTAQGGYKI